MNDDINVNVGARAFTLGLLKYDARRKVRNN